MKAIALERVESRLSTKYKRLIRKDEIRLKKGNIVCYLLANTKCEDEIENQKRVTDSTFSSSL